MAEEYVIVDKTDLETIADSVREKSSTTDKYSVAALAEAIANTIVPPLPTDNPGNKQLVTDREGVVKWEEKPFYYFQGTEIIAWDGDTTGREEVPYGDGISFWKISDTIYPPYGIIGSTFTIMNNGVPEDIVITDEMFKDLSSNIPGVWVVVYNRMPILGSSPAVDQFGSSGGLYYLKTDTYYVSSSSLIKTTLKEIDPVYIPEIPVEKLPTIPEEKIPDTFDTFVIKCNTDSGNLFGRNGLKAFRCNLSNNTALYAMQMLRDQKAVIETTDGYRFAPFNNSKFDKSSNSNYIHFALLLNLDTTVRIMLGSLTSDGLILVQRAMSLTATEVIA